MSETLEITLHNRPQAWADINAQLFPFLKVVLQGGGRWVLTVAKRKRTKPQNRRYWGRGIMAHVDYHVCIRRDARDTVKSFDRIDKEKS
jgi:hypothetical protein